MKHLCAGAFLAMSLHVLAAHAQSGSIVVESNDPLLRLLTAHPLSRFAVAAELIANPALISTDEIRQQTSVPPMKYLFRASKTAQAALQFVLASRDGIPTPARARRPAETPPNIVLISVDGLRPSSLGAYGASGAASPRIDALAAAGAVFLDATTASEASLPAAVSLVTGLAPERHGLADGVERGKKRLGNATATLAAILHERAYATAGFFTHPSFDGTWGLGRGFDLYQGRIADAVGQTAHARMWLDWHAFHVARGLAHEPFFLFVELSDLRDPSRVPGAYLALVAEERDDSDAAATEFAAAVRYVDDQIGILATALTATGIGDDTLFVVTAGPALPMAGAPSAPPRAVPLVLRFPRRIAAGQRVGGSARTVDILPTLAAFAGGAAVADVDGIDLSPYLRRPGGAPIEVVPRVAAAD